MPIGRKEAKFFYFREKGELDVGCDLISWLECKKSLTLIVVLPRIGNRRLDKGKIKGIG
jgi:hypothetical protein